MPTTPGTVVVGLDGSRSSRLALEWAVTQAAAEQRGLTLVHGLGAGPSTTPEHGAEGRRILAEAHEMVANRDRDLAVDERLGEGFGCDLLLECSTDAALVVVGSRGTGQQRSIGLGSIGPRLSRHAQCPVVVHRPWHPGVVRRGVLVVAQGASEPALAFAFRQADLRGLPLTVLRISPDGTAPPESADLAAAYPRVRVETKTARAVSKLWSTAAPPMNLVVVAADPEGEGLEESVSLQVLEHAACPVAVVPTTSGP